MPIKVFCQECGKEITDVGYAITAIDPERLMSGAIREATYLHWKCIIAWVKQG